MELNVVCIHMKLMSRDRFIGFFTKLLAEIGTNKEVLRFDQKVKQFQILLY